VRGSGVGSTGSLWSLAYRPDSPRGKRNGFYAPVPRGSKVGRSVTRRMAGLVEPKVGRSPTVGDQSGGAEGGAGDSSPRGMTGKAPHRRDARVVAFFAKVAIAETALITSLRRYRFFVAAHRELGRLGKIFHYPLEAQFPQKYLVDRRGHSARQTPS
jgi:hypothetical protein